MDIRTAISNILKANGIDDFTLTDRYLRIGYWEMLDSKTATELSDYIDDIDCEYDEDCGWLYSYPLKKA